MLQLSVSRHLNCHFAFASDSQRSKAWIPNSVRAANNQDCQWRSFYKGNWDMALSSFQRRGLEKELMAFCNSQCTTRVFSQFLMIDWLRSKVTWSYISILKKAASIKPCKERRGVALQEKQDLVICLCVQEMSPAESDRHTPLGPSTHAV